MKRKQLIRTLAIMLGLFSLTAVADTKTNILSTKALFDTAYASTEVSQVNQTELNAHPIYTKSDSGSANQFELDSPFTDNVYEQSYPVVLNNQDGTYTVGLSHYQVSTSFYYIRYSLYSLNKYGVVKYSVQGNNRECKRLGLTSDKKNVYALTSDAYHSQSSTNNRGTAVTAYLYKVSDLTNPKNYIISINNSIDGFKDPGYFNKTGDNVYKSYLNKTSREAEPTKGLFDISEDAKVIVGNSDTCGIISSNFDEFSEISINADTHIRLKRVLKVDDGYLVIGEADGSSNPDESTDTNINLKESKGGLDLCAIKLNNEFKVTNINLFGGTGTEHLYDASISPNGNIVIAAYLSRGNGVPKAGDYVIKLDKNGHVTESAYAWWGDTDFYSVAATDDGGVLIGALSSGGTVFDETASPTARFIKLDSRLSFEAPNEYDGEGNMTPPNLVEKIDQANLTTTTLLKNRQSTEVYIN